ncbi:hypothetical protein EYF80_019494 [Liparis tanakae]|uniref:Secreted protein n=1 Tax=Liparis tanakae TaxID=230148 RepID=A0A4Z2HXM3_9TELE|nr:hypothetical protein EYF80_019494 [Liparis tanakae]
MKPSLVMACLHMSQLLAFLNGFILKVCVWTPSSSSGCGRKRKEEGSGGSRSDGCQRVRGQQSTFGTLKRYIRPRLHLGAARCPLLSGWRTLELGHLEPPEGALRLKQLNLTLNT